MALDLVSIPHRADLGPPPEDPAKQREWLTSLVNDYNRLYGILLENTRRLSAPVRAPARKTPGIGPAGVGYGIGVDHLRKLPTNQAMLRFNDGLQLANGADRGKVNVSYRYLAVGNVILGDGSTTTLTADLAVAGANGLDTGSEAANTWYYLYVIADDHGSPVLDSVGSNRQAPHWRLSSTRAALLSTSATAPSLPPGYNRFRLVGAVRNNGSSDLYRFTHAEDDDMVWWNEDVSAGDFLVLSTTAAAVAFTDVSCAAVAPSVSRLIGFAVSLSDTVASGIMVKDKSSGNIVYAGGLEQVSAAANVSGRTRFVSGCDSSQVVQYRGAANTNDINLSVVGYRFIV